jgi:mannose/cellobiose epimerase-like protein (N-acyl-D-glucosamine 2-epimerase family)
MSPVDEAKRMWTQLEMQRAAVSEEQVRALHMIGESLGRIADVAGRFLSKLQNRM